MAGAGEVHMRLMGTTDLHVHLHPYDYYTDTPNDAVGLARTAAHIVAARAEAANALLFDDGDFLQGNPMGDYVAQERGLGDGDVHPVIAAMNALGFDAATLGNHEFDYGLDYLERTLRDAAFPVVSANLARTGRDGDLPPIAPPWVILERVVRDGAGARHGLRVGVIGFVPPQIADRDGTPLGDRVRTRDILSAAQEGVPALLAAGADVVVALVHSGIGPVRSEPMGLPESPDASEKAATALAGVPGIDAIFAGHAHLVFPSSDYAGLPGVDVARGTLQGTPAAMAGFWGSHLGVIDLALRRTDGRWRVVDHEVEARPIADRSARQGPVPRVGSVSRILAETQAMHEETLAYVRRPLGRAAAPIHSFFASVTGCGALRLVAEAQAAHVRQQLVGTVHEGLPVLSAVAPFMAGGRGGPDHYVDIPAGPMVLRHAASLYIYPNTVRAVLVTGRQLADWLERSAGQFLGVAPGAADAPLIDREFPCYNFDVIHGVTWRIDLSRPAADGRTGAPGARRVVDLCHHGVPVDPLARFVVATNDYRAGGGGGFAGADGTTTILASPQTNRDIVVRHIAARCEVDPSGESCWSFVPMPGATVTFDTSPNAVRHIGDGPAGLELLGDAPGGFARYRMRL
jgi:2',3'-cyclic-nucleotide 2'-phosphodiesterase/3'-nucleotidase